MTLRWVPGWNGLTEPEAVSYVAAVEAADGQELEFGVAKAINDFVLGCKNDGIWDAIKASCILAGARTLDGALVPLVGTAPTNYNFVSGDYNRETGLNGDGSTKYLDSNRNNNADPQNNSHLAVYLKTVGSVSKSYAGCGTADAGVNQLTVDNNTSVTIKCRTTTPHDPLVTLQAGLYGASRNNGSTYIARYNNLSVNVSEASESPFDGSILLFARGGPGSPAQITDARLSFYSIGESLDLALLDARVTTLMSDLAAAIP